MYEVEVKVAADHGPVRERLAALSAERLGAVHQRDAYYDHPARSFVETDEALRLRRETVVDEGDVDGDATGTPGSGPTTATLTYKGPRVDDASKTREEVETSVGDPDAAAAVLAAIGFSPVGVVEKERDRFRLDGYTVALDTVADLGQFVEVEASAEADDVEAIREGAVDRCRRLGLDPAGSVRTSYLELLLGDGAAGRASGTSTGG